METWLLCGRRLWLRGSAFPSGLSLQLLPLSGARTSGGQSWLSKMASTARPSRPWLLMVWPLPLLRCCRLTKHPQSAPPTLPTGLVPPLVLCPPPPPPQSLSLSPLSGKGLGLSQMALPRVHLVCAQAISGKLWGALPLTWQVVCWHPSPACQFSGCWSCSILGCPPLVWCHAPGKQEAAGRSPSHCSW